MVSSATMHRLDDIAQREAELESAFTPGALPSHAETAVSPAIEPDLSPLSVAIDGNAYFVMEDDRGSRQFSKDGIFHVERGMLVDRHGMAVLGYHGGDTLLPIRLDPVDAALGRTANLRIQSDGRVYYERRTIDPVTRTIQPMQVVVGRVALARFSAATRLHEVDSTRWTAPSGVPPHLGQPSDGNFLPLVTHAHQKSAIDPLAAIDRLQESYMALDALRAVHGAQGRTEKIAMDLLK